MAVEQNSSQRLDASQASKGSHPASEAFVQRFAGALVQTERGSRAELEAWQHALLKRLVSFAWKECPFYRERLAPLFRHGDTPDLGAWREIPILRRSDLSAEIDRINPAHIPADLGPISTRHTSGTTSGRLAFRTCALAQWVAECMMHRLYRWHRFELHAPMASIRTYGSGRRGYPYGLTESRWSFLGPAAPHHTLDLRTSVQNLVSWLIERRPTYLLTFPSIAHEIAECRDARRIRELGLKKIVAISEIVADDARVAVRDRLGCEMAQIYACAEMGCIGLQSPIDDHILLCEETVLAEILGDDDRPVMPGDTGRVVLTSFYNYATPFIRYEIGDYATLGEGFCPSGLSLERLERVEGRRRNALIAADGRKVWPGDMSFNKVVAKLPVRRFQVRQPDPETVELVYVPNDRGVELDADGLVDRFSALIGRPITLVLSPEVDIERTAAGKHERIVSAVI
jgi:phenylacetate-CoA ligase